MQIAQHADRSEALTGLRAEDIHQWIDGFFDAESFGDLHPTGPSSDYDPYNHRKYRHCAEAMEDACTIFKGRYTCDEIKAVFESHIRDDYHGYMPCEEDFENGTFTEKYHGQAADEELEAILSEGELKEYFKGAAYAKKSQGDVSAGFYWRIVWPTLIAAILFASSSFAIILPLYRRDIMEQKREMIKELTQTAASAIAFYVHQEKDNLMTRAAAQAEAAAEIAELRYGEEGKDYFWITDMKPVMIMHPYRPDLSGRDLTDYTDTEDKSGKRLFVEFVDLVRRNGEGYLEYEWQWKDDPTRSVPKLSYVRGIPEWNWIIGTGIYVHDVEAEIDELSVNLWIADGVIALILLAILGNLLFQSRRIEQGRTRAQSGLREAKNRYRALVEASGEGSLLTVDGKTVYSNQVMRELTGYDEEELTSMAIAALLADGVEINRSASTHFQRICLGEASSSEFEAVLKTKNGATKEVWISTARRFFSEKQGHVIHISPLMRSQEETLRGFHAAGHAGGHLLEDLKERIGESKTPGELIRLLGDFPARIGVLADQGIRPELLRHIIGSLFDITIQRFSQLIPQPASSASFAVLSLGSAARHEMTLFSDQDNALIFADVPEAQRAETRRAFLRFSDALCGRLKQAGWAYCPGGIMAANPKWCLSLKEWKEKFSRWILDATPQSILEVNVFLDIRCAYGESQLIEELREHVHALTKQNPEFLMHYARNCLQYKAPLTMFGHLKAKQSDGHKTINIKQSLKPIETYARIYALKHALPEVGTLERILRLQELGVVQKEAAREMGDILNHLWQLRFYNQLLTDEGLPSINDEVDIEQLTQMERHALQSVLSSISSLQTQLSYDFLGTIAY